MEISGRIAVVTGAAGGIGGAIVRALTAAGARLIVAADLNEAAVADGSRVLARRLDVADEAATKSLVEEIEREHGPVDLWFANAGVAGGGGPEAPDAMWMLQWNVNVMAHVYATRALLPGWLARGEGHLVTTASMAGLLSTVGDGVYATTKHAAVGYAEWLAFTYGDRGVHVSCVCPGAVDTDMLRGTAGGDAQQAAAKIGGGEVATPDVAAAAVIAGVLEDRFLIFTHGGLQEFVVGKAQDPERWIRGMRRLNAKSEQLR
jgi:NAD(P)-dependent dehydrogenase (short-subunit alcohol dehydrogenase family)